MTTMELPTLLSDLKKAAIAIRSMKLNYEDSIVGLNDEMESEFTYPIKVGEWIQIDPLAKHYGLRTSSLEKEILVEMKSGFEMGKHDHTYEQTVILIEGELEINVWNGKKHTVILKEGDYNHITIPALTTHTFKVKKDTRCVIRWTKTDLPNIF